MGNNTSSVSTSNNIVAFSFENHAVRGFEYRGEAHFIGNEVTDALGYTNASKALNDHCKALTKLNYNESLEMGLTEQGKNLRGISIIPERDVYRLVMRSNLPTAEAFEEKVVGEILPAIRKTGGYIAAAPEETPEELALRTMMVLQETIKRQKLEIEVSNERVKLQAAMLEVSQPKADALDRISIASGEYGLTETAKMIQIKPGKFFDWLDSNRCRYTKGKVKLAYQDKIDAGYFRNRATFYTDANGEQQAGNTIRVTPKGLTWLARVVPGAKLDPAFKDIAEAAPSLFDQAAGNAERMTMRQIIDALAVAPSAFTGTRPVGVKKTYLRQVARAVMQMWGDLESDEQKALA